ncbi:MAG: hypothetical protein HYV06_09670 [Deltaproteobacteria bacterium]|nr:hypothetical protein [Deltaproteobacteria bacterium]
MKIVRITVAAVLFILFCWLNWWVLPELAIVRFNEKGTPIPKTGYLLLGEENNKTIGHRVVKDIKFDWPSVPAAWPYVVVGTVLGFGIGYVVGELARRKFAIDVASKQAIDRANKIMTKAVIRDGEAEGKLLRAASLEKDTLYMQNTLRKEIDECRAARATADEQIRICEEKLRKGENTEQELDKSKKQS